MVTPLPVLFEDNHLLVVDKPTGLLTQATAQGDDTVIERVKAYLKDRWQKPGNVYVGLVHRLDRATSGVLVLAKTSKAAARLSDELRTRQGFEKVYRAIVHGVLATPRRLLHHLLEVDDGVRVFETSRHGTKPAELDVAIVGRSATATLVEVELRTGRKHQIRAQLAAIGHPVFGDRRYGSTAKPGTRVMLHACEVSVIHPTTRQRLVFRSPIPEDFQRVLGQVGIAPSGVANE